MKKPWKTSLNLQENLRRHMPELTAEYFSAGRQAMLPGTSWEDMHAFRLLTKRFRYTLETFRDAYGPAMDRRIESLKEVQTFLGDINDAVVTLEMLAGIEETENLRSKLERRSEDKAQKLRHFWTSTFDAPEEERRWILYLVNYACRGNSIPRSHRISSPE